jgi:sugar O-acyltransferase (sialic acid O-acetyltransferase NeuD family)
VLGDLSWLEARPDVLAMCALSSPRSRARLVARLEAAGVRFATVVSPLALLPKRIQPPRIGEGSLVGSNTVLDVNATLGRHTVVHSGAIVGHDSVLGDHAMLLPGAIVAGNVVVGAGAVLGTGVRVIQRVRVGPGAVVGAGAVVVSDLPPNCIAVGVPARVVHVAGGWAEWDPRKPGAAGTEPQRLEAGGGGAEGRRTEPASGAARTAPRTRL